MPSPVRLAVLLSAFAMSASAAHAQTTLVTAGRSTYSIVIPATAPKSVTIAAEELRKDIQLATGADLPVIKDDVAPAGPFISLGATKQAAATDLNKDLKEEGFRIATRTGNVYILGPDTPDGGWTNKGGLSNGTANGIYTFLQDYLGVRWLMPGDLGRDVPVVPSLTLPNLDRVEAPHFNFRRVTHLWDYADGTQQANILRWCDRQRQGATIALDHDHNWWRAVNDNKTDDATTPAVRALYKDHPEWFAMDAKGNRPLPTNSFGKFETTNPELVQWFADKAVKVLKASPKPRTYSLSPSDGNLWSQSPESKPYYEPNPSSAFDHEVPSSQPSTSPLVLKWYRDVSAAVARDYPEGRLTGYIYASYIYPPKQTSMQLPENFIPVICGIGTYGYGLYREDNQKRYAWVMDAWSKVAPKDWYYYDLPNQLLRQHDDEIGGLNFPGSTGIVTPTAPEILDTVFATLTRNHIAGTYIYGVPSWSNAAMANYMLAQMEWNPSLKAADIQKEWLVRAYGPQSGAVMDTFYIRLNTLLGDYVRTHLGNGEHVTQNMLEEVYAKNYAELEKLFLQASKLPQTEPQRARLNLIRDNLVVLQWRLRNAGTLLPGFKSELKRTNDEVESVVTRYNADFPLFPGALTSNFWNDAVYIKPIPWKVQLAAATVPVSTTPAPGLGDSRFLIYAAQAGEIRITPKTIAAASYFPSYEIRDQAGKIFLTGLWQPGKTVSFRAEANTAYSLAVPARKGVNYDLVVENAAIANGSLGTDGLSLSGKPAPVYIYYAPTKSPVGLYESAEGVHIKRPLSASTAVTTMAGAYSNVRVLASLDTDWRFAPDPKNDGITRGVLDPNFDDSTWKLLSAIDWWQSQGFPDYHGNAWYRAKFNAPQLPKTDRARIYFGAIDGNATIYLNGVKVGEHILGENFEGWDKPFSIYADPQVLQVGENQLTVQVRSKNTTTATGITKGVTVLAGTLKPQ